MGDAMDTDAEFLRGLVYAYAGVFGNWANANRLRTIATRLASLEAENRELRAKLSRAEAWTNKIAVDEPQQRVDQLRDEWEE